MEINWNQLRAQAVLRQIYIVIVLKIVIEMADFSIHVIFKLCQPFHLCVFWENSIVHDDSNLVLLVITLPVQIHETHSILRGKRTTRPILNCTVVNKTPDLSATARIVVGTSGLKLGRSGRLCNTGGGGGRNPCQNPR